MTKFLEDILRQPAELKRSLTRLLGDEKPRLELAASVINRALHIYITGIGASWNAAVAAASFFHAAGRFVSLIEAAELLHFSRLAPGSVIIVISRSGRSVEIVNLLSEAKSRKAKIVAITNTTDNPLARESDVTVSIDAAFDHSVSVTMYSALAMAAGLVACAASHQLDRDLGPSLSESLLSTESRLDHWQRKMEESDWLLPDAHVYFLARGASLASCHAARLLWEEAAKAPATAMGTGSFRHGPLEIVTTDLRFVIWLDQHLLRAEDLALAADLRRLGAYVMLIGENIPDDASHLVFSLPASPRGWQFLIDIMPAQLAAERLSHLRGVDCDSFRLCTYIVEKEGGIIYGNRNPVGEAIIK